MKKYTQGRDLIAMLKRRSMSTLDMQQLGLSTCPWKRIVEQLRPDEELIKSKRYPEDGRWYYVYRVVASRAQRG